MPQAIKAHQQAIKIQPDNADAWSSQGLAYMRLQQYPEALKSFDQAQNIKPEDPTIGCKKA
ncbi:MAG: tetratricopeptide repeat protein [Hydrococcus sp. SU_1_0]|nr:tetratricopeptide repeat protein [Hydrococcus sp. SU_1_0]